MLSYWLLKICSPSFDTRRAYLFTVSYIYVWYGLGVGFQRSSPATDLNSRSFILEQCSASMVICIFHCCHVTNCLCFPPSTDGWYIFWLCLEVQTSVCIMVSLRLDTSFLLLRCSTTGRWLRISLRDTNLLAWQHIDPALTPCPQEYADSALPWPGCCCDWYPFLPDWPSEQLFRVWPCSQDLLPYLPRQPPRPPNVFYMLSVMPKSYVDGEAVPMRWSSACVEQFSFRCVTVMKRQSWTRPSLQYHIEYRIHSKTVAIEYSVWMDVYN